MSEPAGPQSREFSLYDHTVYLFGRFALLFLFTRHNTILLLFNEFCEQNSTPLRPNLDFRNVKIIQQHRMCVFMEKISEKEMTSRCSVTAR